MHRLAPCSRLVTGAEATSALTAYAPMALSAWKGKASLAIMVDKSETTQMLDKIVSHADD